MTSGDIEKFKPMRTTAKVVDGVQMVLAVFLVGVAADTLVTVIIAIVFGLWISMEGLMTTDVSIRLIKVISGEAIPIVNIYPMWSKLFKGIIDEETKRPAPRKAELSA